VGVVTAAKTRSQLGAMSRNKGAKAERDLVAYDDTPTWLPVPGYEGWYEASDQGDVRSLDRAEQWGQYTRRRRGRLLKANPNPAGYLQVGLCKDGGQANVAVHRVVAAAFLGPRPAEHEVRHLNGQKTDNRAENLAWGTAKENAADRQAHGNDRFYNAARRQDSCRRGHRLEGPNLDAAAFKRTGKRRCLSCARAWESVDAKGLRGDERAMQEASDREYVRICGEAA
jgi:HNH endonuclease/NUMOD4 motif-containing protein